MKKENIKKIYEAVGLLFAFMLILGTMIQSSIAVEIKPDNNMKIEKITQLYSNQSNKFRVRGRGQLSYLFPKGLDNFSGEISGDENQIFINGYIKNTDIFVSNKVISGIKPRYAFLFVYNFEPFRIYFRLMLPRYFEITNLNDLYNLSNLYSLLYLIEKTHLIYIFSKLKINKFH